MKKEKLKLDCVAAQEPIAQPHLKNIFDWLEGLNYTQFREIGFLRMSQNLTLMDAIVSAGYHAPERAASPIAQSAPASAEEWFTDDDIDTMVWETCDREDDAEDADGTINNEKLAELINLRIAGFTATLRERLRKAEGLVDELELLCPICKRKCVIQEDDGRSYLSCHHCTSSWQFKIRKVTWGKLRAALGSAPAQGEKE